MSYDSDHWIAYTDEDSVSWKDDINISTTSNIQDNLYRNIQTKGDRTWTKSWPITQKYIYEISKYPGEDSGKDKDGVDTGEGGQASSGVVSQAAGPVVIRWLNC